MHITAGPGISRAFILGAGLGTRLRPLTHVLPKPLIPFFSEPLVLHSMRRCYDCGIREFIINTHHLAEAWDQAFPERSWNGCPVHFSHEPVLLDSGGGVKKIEPLASAEEPLLVINGDMAAVLSVILTGETTACENCGREIQQIAKRKKKRFCCDKCRNEWWNSHLDQVKRKAVYDFRCPCCGKEFHIYGDKRRKYCSHECYIADRFKGGDGDE